MKSRMEQIQSTQCMKCRQERKIEMILIGILSGFTTAVCFLLIVTYGGGLI